MALYYYLKKEKPSWGELAQYRLALLWQNQSLRRGISGLVLFFGLVLIGNGILPIINYQIRYAPGFAPVYSPVVEGTNWHSPLVVSAKEEKDYTLISSWFQQQPQWEKGERAQIYYYTLDIPALEIKNAVVHLGGEDLKEELVQYPNTAVPGDYGNTVIFGHSVLPQFFDPNNYLTIFSTLFRLKEGDQIIIHYDGVRYSYQVEEIFEVLPTDLTVLSQRFDGKVLSLITCTPPGTYLRRLVVRARLNEG